MILSVLRRHQRAALNRIRAPIETGRNGSYLNTHIVPTNSVENNHAAYKDEVYSVSTIVPLRFNLPRSKAKWPIISQIEGARPREDLHLNISIVLLPIRLDDIYD
jgi:hypothetical protein